MNIEITSKAGLIGFYEGSLKGLSHRLEIMKPTSPEMSYQIERIQACIIQIIKEGDEIWEKVKRSDT